MSSMEFTEAFENYTSPVLASEKISGTKKFIQHGSTSCYAHSVAVAFYSLKLANQLRIPCDRESLVKGALLHDYFLYDWHTKDKTHRLHGFTHPRTALANAMTDYRLNRIEQDIILRHMFPLTPMPPRYTESAIICVVDKLCSIAEIFRLNALPSFTGWSKLGSIC